MNNKPVHGDYVQGSPATHPGVPVGNDRVPAWLAPNEFVVNQEATAMYGPQIEAMNNHGRAVQAQKGDSVPPMPAEVQYLEAGGLVDFLVGLAGQQAQTPVPQQAPVVQTAAPQMVAPAIPQTPVPQQAPVVQTTAPQIAPTAIPQAAVPPTEAPPAPKFDMFSGSGFGNYANAIASIESGGLKDPYSIYGGYNSHYVGKYQLGSEAISDASRFLGMERTPSREEVRKNPQLQERLFNAFTQVNHRTLERTSSQYRGMDPTEQQRYLGYAHNQGAGGALEFLKTGVAGKDGWGTNGTKYMTAVARGQGANSWAPGDTSAARMTIPGSHGPQSTPGYEYFMPGDLGQEYSVPEGEYDVPSFNIPEEYLRSILGDGEQSAGSGSTAANVMPSATPPGFIPQGVAAQRGGTNPIFQDPAFKTMADRSGLGVQGYWDSLHPTAQEQHMKRINAGPAIYTDQSQIDVLNRIGANSGLAATSEDYDLPQTEAGLTGSPIVPPVPAMESAPIVPSTEMAVVPQAAPAPMEVPAEMDTPPVVDSTSSYTERGPRQMTDDEALGILQNPDASKESVLNAQKHLSGNSEVPSEDQGPMTQDEAIVVFQDPSASPSDVVEAQGAFDGSQKSGQDEADSTEDADPAVVPTVADKVDEAVKVADTEGESVPNDLTDKDAITAGDKAATADPSAFSGALGSIKDFFGDLFDAKELKRMAILYLGARVSGASHGASLAFSGKSYLTRVDAKQTAYNKVAAAGTYTKESIDIFKKTRDYNDLALKAVPNTMTGILKTFYDEKGNEVRAQQVQNGDNKFYVDGNGKQINPLAYSETKPADREAQITKTMSGVEGILGDLRTQYSYDPEKKKYNNAIIPSVDARKIAEWAVKNDVPPEQMGSVIDAAYHDMMNSKGGGREVRSLVPYIRQNVQRQKLGGNAGVFVVEPASEGKPAKYIAPHLLETLNKRASDWLGSEGAAGTADNLSNQFYTAAMTVWNSKTVEERKKYNDGAGEGANGFYEFADDWLRDRNF